MHYTSFVKRICAFHKSIKVKKKPSRLFYKSTALRAIAVSWPPLDQVVFSNDVVECLITVNIWAFSVFFWINHVNKGIANVISMWYQSKFLTRGLISRNKYREFPWVWNCPNHSEFQLNVNGNAKKSIQRHIN